MGFLYLLERIRTPWLTKLMLVVTELGGETVFLVLALAMFWALDKKKGYLLMTVGFAAFELLPSLLLGMFSPSQEMLEIGRYALRIIGTTFPLAGFCIIAGSVFQAIGNPLHSLINSVCRQLVVLLPAAWLLAQTGNLTLVWFAFPIAEVMSLIMSLIFLRKTMRSADARMLAMQQH